jgi:hypothetical protein
MLFIRLSRQIDLNFLEFLVIYLKQSFTAKISMQAQKLEKDGLITLSG